MQGMEEFVLGLSVPRRPLTVAQLLGILSGHARRCKQTLKRKNNSR